MMKRLLLLFFALAALASPAWAGGLLLGSGVAVDVEWYYPNNVSIFDETSSTYAATVILADRFEPGANDTITTLSTYIADVGTSTECSIAVYNEAASTKYGACHFSPVLGWNECSVDISISSGSKYHVYMGCNGDHKIKRTTNSCINSYSVLESYVTDLPASLSQSGATNCVGIRMK